MYNGDCIQLCLYREVSPWQKVLQKKIQTKKMSNKQVNKKKQTKIQFDYTKLRL